MCPLVGLSPKSDNEFLLNQFELGFLFLLLMTS